MSIQKLKNRLKGLEAEVFGHQRGRIPQEEQCLVVSTRSSETKEEVEKKFEILKDKLREKYGDFDDTDVICIRIIDHFDPESLEKDI